MPKTIIRFVSLQIFLFCKKLVSTNSEEIMCSLFDLFFDTSPCSPEYVISDSEMMELLSEKKQQELQGIINQKKRLEESY